MLAFHPDKTKIVFFDLEYYVPVKDRKRKTLSGMAFSPFMPGHRIIGGTFLTYYPMQDRIGERSAIWEWERGSEGEVLRDIFELFEREWRSIEAGEPNASLMLAGIGISHSDIPALLARLSSYSIAENHRIHDLLCGCRQIDLATATYCQFTFKHSYFAYPKTKSALYQKYLNGKRIDSGISVWDHYDGKSFNAIENRCKEEVDDALSIYKTMFNIKNKNDKALRRLKRLERDAQAKG